MCYKCMLLVSNTKKLRIAIVGVAVLPIDTYDVIRGGMQRKYNLLETKLGNNTHCSYIKIITELITIN